MIREHSRVTLSASVETDDHDRLPKGSVGTVVAIWGHGAAYEVEFTKPFHAVVTVPASKLLPEGR